MAISRGLRFDRGAGFVVALVCLRWLAGIAENFGVPAASEFAAAILLTGLGLIFLTSITADRKSALLCIGLLGWIATAFTTTLVKPDIAIAPAVNLMALLTLYVLFANNGLPALARAASTRGLEGFFAGFILVGGALAIIQTNTSFGFHDATRPDLVRAQGSDVHPVSFGIQLVAAAVGFMCIRIKRSRLRDPLTAFMILAAFIALYLTYARTAWGIAAICAARFVWARLALPGRVLLLGATPAIIITGLSSARFDDLKSFPDFWRHFSFSDPVFDYRYIDNSLSWRVVNWAQGLGQALERPLLGWGPGQSASASRFALEMHNIFLECFFEGGVFGLGFLLVVLAGLLRIHRELPKITAEDRHANLLANWFGVSLLLAVTVSTSLVDQLMTITMYFLVLAAAGQPTPKVIPPQRPGLH